MKFRYLPMTDQDKEDMLNEINVSSIEDLFNEIPEEITYKNELNLPKPLDEITLMRHMKAIGNKNQSTEEYISFLGAGVYNHYIPSVVSHITGRSEFYTAYTPYQPEISQGELQAIFEFQTMICEITGMEVANSSMYDGFTAVTEGAWLATNFLKRSKILISKSVHPQTREILHTFFYDIGIDILEVDIENGITDLVNLDSLIDSDVAAVIIQYPNFLGCIEDVRRIADIAHSKGAFLICSAYPMALGLLEAPGNMGADIVVGDTQSLGLSQSFGGPHCGFFAISDKLKRKIPGRVVGQTVDSNGQRGFVLTLQAREQHIRREKATSNICSNQALNALASSVFMSAVGKQGLKELSSHNYHKAHYAKEKLKSIPGINIVVDQPFFNELLISFEHDSCEHIAKKLNSYGIISGLDLSTYYPEYKNAMLIAVTDMHTKEHIDYFCSSLEEVLCKTLKN